jgi:hypothetical protein
MESAFVRLRRWLTDDPIAGRELLRYMLLDGKVTLVVRRLGVPAFAALRDAVDAVPRSAMATVLLALALLRCEEATAHLLGTVERAARAIAAMAITALALHKHDDGIAGRVRSIVDARREPRLREAFAAKFG